MEMTVPDKGGFKEAINKIEQGETNEINVKISGFLSPYELLKILGNPRINVSRSGFKRWRIQQVSISSYRSNSHHIIIIRFFTLFVSIIFFILVIYWTISHSWIILESHFKSLPIAANVIGSIISIIIVSLILKYLKQLISIIKEYLGVHYERRH